MLEKSRIALTHPALEETVWLKRHRAGHRVKPGQGTWLHLQNGDVGHNTAWPLGGPHVHLAFKAAGSLGVKQMLVLGYQLQSGNKYPLVDGSCA